MIYNIEPERTAINTGYSNTIRLIAKEHDLEKKILDYGAGRLRNALKLKELGFNVSILDTLKQISNVNKSHIYQFEDVYSLNDSLDIDTDKKYDVIICNYVLNVIPDIHDRIKTLKNIELLSHYDTTIYIEVRGKRFLKTAKTKVSYKDGYVLGKNEVKTFQKPYDRSEIENFILTNSNLNILDTINTNDALCCICKLNKNKLKLGQMSLKSISNKADYLQLDICGLNVEEAVNRYLNYNYDIPVILHGDWTKKGASENNLDKRYKEYINIINELKKYTNVLGFTLHPPTRAKMSLSEMNNIVKEIEKVTSINVFVENRSSSRINLSTPEEIIEYSKEHYMTIDIPQLYISCSYNEDLLIDVLKKINMDNVKEIHLANILRKENHTYVARKINDGCLDIMNIIKLLNKDSYYTLEILGGVNTFNTQSSLL